MQLEEFDYYLPPELIAQKPQVKRSNSRLLCLNKSNGAITHLYFKDLPSLLTPQDLIILNNTKVIPARLYAHKPTGGKVEIFIERILHQTKIIAQTKTSKNLKIGTKLIIDDNTNFTVIGITPNNLFELSLESQDPLDVVLEKFGQVPLPPYIKRSPNSKDKSEYQTIFAKHPGAVAAPTAGLHFDQKLMEELTQKNIPTAFITLHVGMGTFQPVRVKNIHEHSMHHEHFEVPKTTCDKIINTQKNLGRIVAVGTTTVRALESSHLQKQISSQSGDTNIFIYPGYKFKSTDILITNFHLPRSTLLMLVCAFAGYNNTMHAYQEAIKEQYRFYSYGDAMIIF